MSSSNDSDPLIRCKLCRAFAASQLPTAAERRLVGSDSFDRDADIRDACLSCNYAANRIWITTEMWFCITLGCFLATLLGVRIILSPRGDAIARALSGPRVIRIMETFLIALLAMIVPCYVVTAIVLRAYLWRTRRLEQENSAEAQQEDQKAAQRMGWLAIWASLTGHDRFKRRMVRYALKLGFVVDIEARLIRRVAESNCVP